jgi:hypothetical protein
VDCSAAAAVGGELLSQNVSARLAVTINTIYAAISEHTLLIDSSK